MPIDGGKLQGVPIVVNGEIKISVTVRFKFCLNRVGHWYHFKSLW